MKNITLLLSLVLLSAISCNDDETPIVDPNSELKLSIQEDYANLVYNNYSDAYQTALDLQNAISEFLTDPEDNTKFEAAKDAWRAAREPYGQTEAFRFSSGPIDAEDGPEGQINAWPLDEVYIDYVDGNADGGIINDTDTHPTITPDLLLSLNEAGGETNISVGYHAIEFLLWGQDLTNPADKLSGQRPNTDFVDGGTASNQDRRRQYLQACANILVDDLKTMVDAWTPSASGNYRTTFLELPTETAIKNMLTGIGVLSKSELAGERIFTAYDNRDQEDEHSCFSDNTHRDIRLNALGIKNVYTCSYTKVDGSTESGTSIHDLIAAVDPDLAMDVLAQLNAAVEATYSTAEPFDLAISDNATRPQVLTAVNELRSLGDQFAAAGTAIGLTINTALPE